MDVDSPASDVEAALRLVVEGTTSETGTAFFRALFRARNQWDHGGHNVATVDTFFGTCREMEHKTPFVMHADEPPVLLGEDNGANPVEFVLAGLSGCMTTTLAYHAAARGLNIEAVSSEFEGDIDLHGGEPRGLPFREGRESTRFATRFATRVSPEADMRQGDGAEMACAFPTARPEGPENRVLR